MHRSTPGSPQSSAEKQYPDVIFLGGRNYQTELPSLYASGDVFVFPGTHETVGLVNGEALASGTPVVAYRVQGPKDIVTSPDAGVLVEYSPTDRNSNLQRLQDAIPKALELNRQKIRSFAVTLSWDSSVGEFLQFLYPLK